MSFVSGRILAFLAIVIALVELGLLTMLRINARGAVLTSIVALVLVLLFVAQWKREEISAWRADAAPNTNYQDTKLDEVTEFKDDAAPSTTPAIPDLSAGNSTLGVSFPIATCDSRNVF